MELLVFAAYVGGMVGAQEAGMGFWKSAVWPYWAARRALFYAAGREMGTRT